MSTPAAVMVVGGDNLPFVEASLSVSWCYAPAQW